MISPPLAIFSSESSCSARRCGAAEIVFGRLLRCRMIITVVSTCVELADMFFHWISRTLAGDLILRGLLATSFPLTILSLFGAWLARCCSNKIDEVQALLRTQSLREKHRNALAGMEWTLTLRFLSVEATISRGKGYIRDLFRRRED